MKSISSPAVMLVAVIVVMTGGENFVQARVVAHPLALDNYGFVRNHNSAFLPSAYPVVAAPSAGLGAANAALEEQLQQEQQQQQQESRRPFGGNENGGAKRSVSLDGEEDYAFDYQLPRAAAIRRRSDVARERELTELYNKIAQEFPFMASQGLKTGGIGNKAPSLNDLFAMTLFGQPSRHGK